MGTEGYGRVPRLARPTLRDFLGEEYRRRGRTAEAIEHTWAAFNSRPALETYRELAIDPQALGEWDERRTLTLLHANLSRGDRKRRAAQAALDQTKVISSYASANPDKTAGRPV